VIHLFETLYLNIFGQRVLGAFICHPFSCSYIDQE